MEAILSAEDALELVKKPRTSPEMHLLYLSHEMLRRECDKLKDTIKDLMDCDCMIDFRVTPLFKSGLDS